MSAAPHLSVVVAIGAAVLVTACGQKGPLTLPDKSAAVITAPPATSVAAPTDKTKDKDKNADSQPPQ
ncbi:MAG TPA: lipoprotein [Steroidobacteraceae bacterium]|jgi:predicted small lipoprotein YifL|nr:lipoprotein [Steroidobacteraceae bacterium]